MDPNHFSTYLKFAFNETGASSVLILTNMGGKLNASAIRNWETKTLYHTVLIQKAHICVSLDVWGYSQLLFSLSSICRIVWMLSGIFLTNC
jgi:hypothetical protein